MSEAKTTKTKSDLPAKVLEDFAGVRDRAQHAVQGLPRPISFEEASKQVALFQTIHQNPEQIAEAQVTSLHLRVISLSS